MISLSLQLGLIPGQRLSPENRKLVDLIVHIYSTQNIWPTLINNQSSWSRNKHKHARMNTMIACNMQKTTFTPNFLRITHMVWHENKFIREFDSNIWSIAVSLDCKLFKWTPKSTPKGSLTNHMVDWLRHQTSTKFRSNLLGEKKKILHVSQI